MPGPLAGVRVLDVTTVVLGPWATQTLGEHSIEVLRETGFSRFEIDGMLASGATAQSR